MIGTSHAGPQATTRAAMRKARAAGAAPPPPPPPQPPLLGPQAQTLCPELVQIEQALYRAILLHCDSASDPPPFLPVAELQIESPQGFLPLRFGSGRRMTREGDYRSPHYSLR